MTGAWTDGTAAAAERAIGYTFRDKGLLVTSFTHASLTQKGYVSNERLEFLGDAVLELLVTERLYRDSDAREGELTELRKRYVSKSALERAERRLGVLKFLRYGSGEDALRGKTASNLIEAIVGAIYLDGGIEAARAFLTRTLEETDTENYKSALQEHTQKFDHTPPVYTTDAAEGGYTSTVCAMGRSASGAGATKKAAETAAAKKLYGILFGQ